MLFMNIDKVIYIRRPALGRRWRRNFVGNLIAISYVNKTTNLTTRLKLSITVKKWRYEMVWNGGVADQLDKKRAVCEPLPIIGDPTGCPRKHEKYRFISFIYAPLKIDEPFAL